MFTKVPKDSIEYQTSSLNDRLHTGQCQCQVARASALAATRVRCVPVSPASRLRLSVPCASVAVCVWLSSLRSTAPAAAAADLTALHAAPDLLPYCI